MAAEHHHCSSSLLIITAQNGLTKNQRSPNSLGQANSHAAYPTAQFARVDSGCKLKIINFTN
jgi:hypothetical protein